METTREPDGKEPMEELEQFQRELLEEKINLARSRFSDEWQPMVSPARITDPSTTNLALQYAEMNHYRVQLEEALKGHKEAMKAIEKQLKERFMQEGVSQIRTRMGLVYLHRQIWGRCLDPDKLAETEWGFLVKSNVNSNSLSAMVRERELNQDGKPDVPPDIAECLEISEVWSVRVRNGHHREVE